jgi:hypothetical protein
MFWRDALIALFIGLIFTGTFMVVIGRVRSWKRTLLAFLMIFFASWAAGKWVIPPYPLTHGVGWFAPLMAGLFMALLLAAETRSARKGRPDPGREPGFSRLYWLVVILLLAAVLGGYSTGFGKPRPAGPMTKEQLLPVDTAHAPGGPAPGVVPGAAGVLQRGNAGGMK